MKTLIMTFILSATLAGGSIYDFKVPGLEGGTIDFAKFKGKKIMIVNTASKCGLTPQYTGLEELYKKHKDKLVIVGFPANNFAGQEPGSNEEIAEFCKRNYGVSFLMAEKISVKGDDTAPIFKWLIEKAAEKGIENPVSWNFTKFLLNEQGELEAVFTPKTEPLSEEITKHLN